MTHQCESHITLTISKAFLLLLAFVYGLQAAGAGTPREAPTARKIAELGSKQNTTKSVNDGFVVLDALASSKVADLIIGLKNEDIVEIAGSTAAALTWVYNNMVTHHPRLVGIRAIAIGDKLDPLDHSGLYSYVLPACLNVYAALKHFELDSVVKVSAPQSLLLIEHVFPPSIARFNQSYLSTFLHPFLQFIHDSSSCFMLNLQPIQTYEWLVGSAIVQLHQGFDDTKSGLHYSDIIDAIVDALFTSMASLGYREVPVVLIETGWHEADHVHGTDPRGNVITYTRSLKSHLHPETGTPLKPGIEVPFFIRESAEALQLFGRATMRTSDRLNVEANATEGATVHTNSVYGMNVGTNATEAAAAVTITSSYERSWCIAKSYATPDSLQAALDWACGFGGADCTPIELGSDCYVPNTIYSHASYAFNSYYQIHQHASRTCNFKGVATVTYEDPSYPGCFYPFRPGQITAANGGAKEGSLFTFILLCFVLSLYLA